MPEPPAQQAEQPGAREYAGLNAVYALALTGLVIGTRNRGEDVRTVLGTNTQR